VIASLESLPTSLFESHQRLIPSSGLNFVENGRRGRDTSHWSSGQAKKVLALKIRSSPSGSKKPRGLPAREPLDSQMQVVY
jgi:hypothetical protein